MQELTATEIEQVDGGGVGLAVVAGLAIGTLLIGCYILYDQM